MKDPRSAVRDLPQDGVEPEADPYMDEAMAMVYVGDVYSLVAQDGVTSEVKAKPAENNKAQKQEPPQDENDALWPFIR